ncbi:MAG: ATP-binding cassette domain-containing protein [Anaerolineae bacterium]|nr:ATP-binding cassette domain-containing protein [Candidatus Roseilinea sp.]MDW8449672.1 ATP-binding cassette domain-containing protein [Anaerolineae bacterium]
MSAQPAQTLLEIKDLRKYFPVQKGFLKRTVGYVKAVDGVSLSVAAGETLGIVGESGSGKTTLGRTLLRLYEPTSGDVTLHVDGQDVPIMDLSGSELRVLRRNAQMIFQDPYASLNPRMTVLETVGEPLFVNGIASGREMEERVREVILQVGLRVEHLRRYPHSFSGGQRQRIGIARALVVKPRLVVADEPVSALDVSIQAQILNLLKDLQAQYQLTYLFISHAMNVVRYMCDRIAVMYAGKLVEVGTKHDILKSPKHPYTEALLASVPRTTSRVRKRVVSAGEVPDLANLPSGCVFHPRCKYAVERCKVEVPQLRALDSTRLVSCHRAEELELQGI